MPKPIVDILVPEMGPYAQDTKFIIYYCKWCRRRKWCITIPSGVSRFALPPRWVECPSLTAINKHTLVIVMWLSHSRGRCVLKLKALHGNYKVTKILINIKKLKTKVFSVHEKIPFNHEHNDDNEYKHQITEGKRLFGWLQRNVPSLLECEAWASLLHF